VETFLQGREERRLESAGHIALEVHDNEGMGSDRWGPGLVCRWRNISIKMLSAKGVYSKRRFRGAVGLWETRNLKPRIGELTC